MLMDSHTDSHNFVLQEEGFVLDIILSGVFSYPL